MICYWRCLFIIVLKISLVATDQSHEVSPRQLLSKELIETTVNFSMTNEVDYYTDYFKPGREVETKVETGSNHEDPADICNQPLEEGSCLFSFLLTRWYYDRLNNKCKMFWYSGCGGNDNNFYVLHDCVKQCVRSVPKDEATVIDLLSTSSQVDNTYTEPSTEETKIWKENRTNVCSQPRDPGYCRWRHIETLYLRWYYKNTTNDCRIFLYTGCGGNGNRFHDRKTCESLCARSISKDITTMPDWQSTSDELDTFVYEDTKTEETIRDLDLKGVKDFEEKFEIIVEDDIKSYRPSKRNISIISTIVICAVAIGLRWLIVKGRLAEQEVQRLRETGEAKRTQQQASSSDEDSSSVRVSMCIISLNRPENQSRNEPTQSSAPLRSDKNYSQSQPFLHSYQPPNFPPAPPPYEP